MHPSYPCLFCSGIRLMLHNRRLRQQMLWQECMTKLRLLNVSRPPTTVNFTEPSRLLCLRRALYPRVRDVLVFLSFPLRTVSAMHQKAMASKSPALAPDVVKHKSQSWLLDPQAYLFGPKMICTMFKFVFFIMEIYSRLRGWMNKTGKETKLKVRSIGERTLVTRQNSLQRKNSVEILMSWLDSQPSDGQQTYEYNSVKEVLEAIVVGMSFSAHGKHMARLSLRDGHKRETMAKVTESIRSIQARAKKSVKFRFLFKALLNFLDDIEKSRASSLIEFVETLANEMLNKPDNWYIEFVHRRLRTENVPQNVYEVTLAILALFFREGAGLESFILKNAWLSPDRGHNAALTLLMYCAVEKCSPIASNEINVTEFSGVERILIASSEQKFHRYVSLSCTKSEKLFKDKMMWDITLNCCNEYVESAWSDNCLERAVWTLQYGIKFVTKEAYHQLEELNGKRKLDLTQLSPLCLLAFSLSGMIRFHGMDDCVYKVTADPEAKIELHGTLPMPTMKDLVSLDIVRQLKGSTFEVKPLPGSENKFKALKVGDRIRLVQSTKTESFTANLDQCVG